jgi:hypothetical protein
MNALAKTDDLSAEIEAVNRRSALFDEMCRATLRGDDETYNEAKRQFWSVPMRSDGEK